MKIYKIFLKLTINIFFAEMKGPEIKKATHAGILYPKKGEELETYI